MGLYFLDTDILYDFGGMAGQEIEFYLEPLLLGISFVYTSSCILFSSSYHHSGNHLYMRVCQDDTETKKTAPIDRWPPKHEKNKCLEFPKGVKSPQTN
jgi:hypothetical protein